MNQNLTAYSKVHLWLKRTASILLVTGFIKVVSGVLFYESLIEIDLVFFKPWFLFSTALYEFVVSYMLLRSGFQTYVKLILAFWTASAFLAAHGLFLLLKVEGCPCLGFLSKTSSGLSNTIVLLVTAYIFAGAIYYFRQELDRGQKLDSAQE